ncbi:MAG: metallophosphoesterase [Clostridiales bacterium]|nr:metallophosphoesterase [Clostridiales bacterium]
MKMKKLPFRLFYIIMCFVLIFSSVPLSVSGAEENESSINFAVMSGLCFVSEDNRGEYNEAFLLDGSAEGLQYENLEGLIDSTFASLKQRVENEGLEYILIDGDLTYNGEYYNHMAFADMLLQLEEETGVNVIVINGDRDVYNVNSSSFATGSREYETFTTSSNFKSIYSELGYDVATNVYKSSSSSSANLSYSVEIGDYRLIVIDGSYFSLTGVTYGTGDTSIYGRISDDLLEWIETECKIAELSGETVIGMCHWSLSGSSLVNSDGVLENADEVANALADAGMHYIFTAGTGKNDITALVSDEGNVIYDVQTGGIMSFPNTYRVTEFTGETASFELVDADEVQPVVSYTGETYEQPYRVTASLKIQYADYDMARYFADIVENYVSTVLIPGVEKNGTLEAFVQSQYGISLTDTINEQIDDGLNLLGVIVIFDATNIMEMLEEMYTQAAETIFSDASVIGDSVYECMKTICDAEISSVPCTAFLDTYGFGDESAGGTINDLLLSIIAYSYYGNETASENAFITDVIENLDSGELVTFLANLLGECLIGDFLFGDILSQIEMKPQYLVFLDDSEGSLGYYLQVAFRAYIALHGEDQSVTGAVNSILSDGFLSEYGRSVDDVIDYFVELYYSGEDAVILGGQLAELLTDAVIDENPQAQGDFNVTYDGTVSSSVYATQDNYRLPSMINVTLGDDPQTEVYITWYTKSTVTGTDIEIYDSKDAEFFGGHFVGVDGVTLNRTSDTIERSYYTLDLGFVSVGEVTLQLKKHVLKISGLSAGSTYFFRVGDSSKKWWSDTISVTTADGSDSVTFIHVSDTAGNSDSDFSVFGNVLNCALQLYPDTDFLLHTGNYVDDSDDVRQWEMFFGNTDTSLLGLAVVPAAGSSDSLESIQNTFTIGELLTDTAREGVYYSYDYNNIHIAVLDASLLNDDGTLADEQVEWLTEDMSSTDADWKFVAISTPVYTNGVSSQSDNHVNYMNQMAETMDSLGVDIVFSGNDCVYYRTNGMNGGVETDTPTVSYPYYNDSSKYYKAITSQNGTVYSAIGSAGVLSQSTHELYDVSSIFNESGTKLDSSLPMFTAVEVVGDILYLTTYTVNADTKTATKVDSLSIMHNVGVKGDINEDGDVTAADARLVLRACAGLELFTTSQKSIADVNGDGSMTPADARLILRAAAGLESL